MMMNHLVMQTGHNMSLYIVVNRLLSSLWAIVSTFALISEEKSTSDSLLNISSVCLFSGNNVPVQKKVGNSQTKPEKNTYNKEKVM